MTARDRVDSDQNQLPETPPRKSGGGFGDLGPRVLSALVLVAAALGSLYVGGDAFGLFWLAAAVAVNWEWQALTGGERRVARTIAGGAALAAAAALARTGFPGVAALEVLVFAAICAILAGRGARLWAAGGVVYAGALIVSVCVLRESLVIGAVAIGWLFALVWGTDIFAYFGGRLVGGPKLWPRVSAGKTWSGTIIGVLSGALLGALTVKYFLPQAHGVTLFAVTLVAAALSQAGDLFESSIKRRFGVKDSSQLIPGHGGAMDRLDGFIFASGFAALLGVLRDADVPAAGLFFW